VSDSILNSRLVTDPDKLNLYQLTQLVDLLLDQGSVDDAVKVSVEYQRKTKGYRVESNNKHKVVKHMQAIRYLPSSVLFFTRLIDTLVERRQFETAKEMIESLSKQGSC